MLQNEHWTEEEPINNYKIAPLKGIAVSLFSQYHPPYLADLQESFFTCLLTAGNL
jgi:hypothetical protein